VRERPFNKSDKGFLKFVDKQSRQPAENDKDYHWLLKEASWQEFWFFQDQSVDWNKKREELKNLNADQSDNLDSL
jgi:hypothetical protein